MSQNVHFMSQSVEWATPDWLFEEYDREFGFTLDVCATPELAKCEKFYSENGLLEDWSGVCWMNPPYGREIWKWLRKAYRSSLKGVTVVCLIPSRTDTAWWHDFVMKADEIRFIRGRLKFGGAKNSAPFPSAMVIFRPAHAAVKG